MSQYETLMARDGHTFNTYIAKPAGKARGGVVIVQEIFGLTPHICRVADDWAQQGYLSVAPSLFSPLGPPRRGPRRPAVPNVSGWVNRSSSSSSPSAASSAAVCGSGS